MVNDDIQLHMIQTNRNSKAPIFIASENAEKNIISNIAVGNEKCDSL